MAKYTDNFKKGAHKPSAGEALFAQLVLIPVLFVLLWNYGVTEFLQQFGVADANVNILVGMLTFFFFRGLVAEARSV